MRLNALPPSIPPSPAIAPSVRRVRPAPAPAPAPSPAPTRPVSPAPEDRVVIRPPAHPAIEAQTTVEERIAAIARAARLPPPIRLYPPTAPTPVVRTGPYASVPLQTADGSTQHELFTQPFVETRISVRRATVSFSTPTGELSSSVPQPTHLGILALAAYYREKNGIEIYYCADSSLTQPAAHSVWPRLAPGQAAGLIVNCGTSDACAHAIPVLLGKTADNTRVVLDLDAIDSGCVPYLNWLAGQSKIEHTHVVYYPDFARQTDEVSCRTDAVHILRDALTDPALQNILQASTELPLRGSFREGTFPHQWGRAIQVPARDAGVDLDAIRLPARSHGSKTLAEKRAKHSRLASVRDLSGVRGKPWRCYLYDRADKDTRRVAAFIERHPHTLPNLLNAHAAGELYYRR